MEEAFVAPTNDYISPSLEEITKDVSSVPEHIGYLKDLGLDYGWGPTAFVEWMIEHVHVYTAAPWWASVLIAAALVRLVLLKPYIEAADTSARIATIQDTVKPIQARVNAAREQKNQQEMMVAANELRALYRKAGIKLWKVAIPFIQIPIGIGSFRLFRGMIGLPVPGLEDGGLLWMQDLTVADPYFVTPLLFAAAVHTTFRVSSLQPSFYSGVV